MPFSSWGRIFKWGGIGIAALIAAGAALLVFALYTAPGQRWLARAVTPLSDGNVTVEGISGTLPNHVHIRHFELRDTRGPWLRGEDITLDWNAFAILGNRLEASRIHAAKAVLLRWPFASGHPSTFTADIGDLAIQKVALNEAAFGHASLVTLAGSVHYASRRNMAATLAARSLDGVGRYRIDGSIRHAKAIGVVDIAEQRNGIASALLRMPSLGPVTLFARAAIKGHQNTLFLTASAGALRANLHGAFDFAARKAELAFAIHAPAMAPRSDLSWALVSADGSLNGTLDSPTLAGTLEIERLKAFRYGAPGIGLRVRGAGGQAKLTGTIAHLTIPGSKPDLFASTPVMLSAAVNLKAKGQPMTFSITHRLASVTGVATLAGGRTADAHLRVASLAPFFQMPGSQMSGAEGLGPGTAADLRVQLRELQSGNVSVQLTGGLASRGSDLVARLLGAKAGLNLAASFSGAGALQSASGDLKSPNLAARFQGSGPRVLDYGWSIAVADLSRVAADVTGTLQLKGTVSGTAQNLRGRAQGTADIGTRTVKRQRLMIEATATGLPNLQSGDVRISGRFAGAPLSLAATIRNIKGRPGLITMRGTWKSAKVSAHVTLANGAQPRGVLDVDFARLADLAPFAGPLSGSAVLQAQIMSKNGAIEISPRATADNLAYGNAKAKRIDVQGRVRNLASPVFALTVAVHGINEGGATGDAALSITGPLNALQLQASSKITANGAPVAVTAKALTDIGKRQAILQALRSDWNGQVLALQSPAAIDYASGFSISGFRARVGSGMLNIAGSVSPKLALAADLSNVKAETLQPFLPVALTGRFSGTARLSGTLSEPRGALELHGRDLRARDGLLSMPASALDASGVLNAHAMNVRATLSGGKSLRLAANGSVPLSTTAPIDMRVTGNAELGLLAASLAQSGQSLEGTATVDARLNGSFHSPRATGEARIADAQFHDYTRGLRLDAIHGTLIAEGTSIRIREFAATAGSGSVNATGGIDLAAPGMPVNIAIEAKKARPISGDLLNATLGGKLALSGKLLSDTRLSGTLDVLQAEINVPQKFPREVAQLDVRRGGRSRVEPSEPVAQHAMALDLTISSQGQVFVRGRGLDAEFAGNLNISGTTDEPQVLGALDMRRGSFQFAGTTLEFQSGKLGFDGDSLQTRLDPTLDFVARSTSGGITTTLTLAGYASSPKIQLSSSPTLPQDEILARMLFQQSITQLSAVQVAELADAFASLGGVDSGLNPVNSIRKSLGLDRLAVGSATSPSGSSAGTTVEAGKYITNKVYVGATQNLSGGTRAVVQVDITRHLKAKVSAGTALQPLTAKPISPEQDTGDSAGLTYQFEY